MAGAVTSLPAKDSAEADVVSILDLASRASTIIPETWALPHRALRAGKLALCRGEHWLRESDYTEVRDVNAFCFPEQGSKDGEDRIDNPRTRAAYKLIRYAVRASFALSDIFPFGYDDAVQRQLVTAHEALVDWHRPPPELDRAGLVAFFSPFMVQVEPGAVPALEGAPLLDYVGRCLAQLAVKILDVAAVSLDVPRVELDSETYLERHGLVSGVGPPVRAGEVITVWTAFERSGPPLTALDQDVLALVLMRTGAPFRRGGPLATVPIPRRPL